MCCLSPVLHSEQNVTCSRALTTWVLSACSMVTSAKHCWCVSWCVLLVHLLVLWAALDAAAASTPACLCCQAVDCPWWVLHRHSIVQQLLTLVPIGLLQG